MDSNLSLEIWSSGECRLTEAYLAKVLVNPAVSTETQTPEFVRAGTLEELKSKGRISSTDLGHRRTGSGVRPGQSVSAYGLST